MKAQNHSFFIGAIWMALTVAAPCDGQGQNPSEDQDTAYQYWDTVFVRYDTSRFAHSLSYKTDTIVFENFLYRYLLIGTTSIPLSENRNSLYPYGLELQKVVRSDCLEGAIGEEDKVPVCINSALFTDSTLVVDINIFENCCSEFLCDAVVNRKGILNLTYVAYGPHCGCDCCFGLTYYFTYSRGEWEQDGAQRVKAILVNGNPKAKKTLGRQ